MKAIDLSLHEIDLLLGAIDIAKDEYARISAVPNASSYWQDKAHALQSLREKIKSNTQCDFL